MHALHGHTAPLQCCRSLCTKRLHAQRQRLRNDRPVRSARRLLPDRSLPGQRRCTITHGRARTVMYPDGLNVVPEHWKQHMEGLADGKKRALLRYFRTVKEINEQEPHLQSLTDDQLKSKTAEFRQRLRAGETLDDLLVETFALVREVSSRVLRLRHFDAQLVGGMVLHEGAIAEMKTGEGKTLVATLPTYLNALTGKGVHVVTVNDYLAERDGNWMGKIFKFLGMTVAIVTDNMTNSARRAPFLADVTYVTAQSLCFTYLYDNTTRHRDYTAITRPFNYAIVDEVDSLLIDDCRNPMLISGPATSNLNRFAVAKLIADELYQHGDYNLDHKGKQATLTEAGLKSVYNKLVREKLIDAAEAIRAMPDGKEEVIIWQAAEPWGPFIINAIKAKELYKKNVDYVEIDGKVHIINKSTGRIQARTRWQDNIHQAVEAKEEVDVGEDTVIQASVTFQCFFRYYSKLAGMTGTAATEAPEFFEVYNLNVVEVPSRLPNKRIDHRARLFPDQIGKLICIYQIVMKAHEEERPVLIGTSSVEESELIKELLVGKLDLNSPTKENPHPVRRVDYLSRNYAFEPFWRGCSLHGHKEAGPWSRINDKDINDYYFSVQPKKFALLNAKPENVRREAQIIAQAGLPGAVTIATNMAGRGTDIVLGGNAKGLALQVLMKLFARFFLSGVDYKANKAALDQVPLEQFYWPEEADPAAAAAQAAYAMPTDQSSDQSPDQSSAAAAAAAPAEIAASWTHMEKWLTADLMKRLKDTAWVCTTADEKIGIDEVQSMINKVLEQAEAVQTQVLTEHWGGVSTFQVKAHATEALRKVDELFNDDKVPAFNSPSSKDDKAPNFGGKGKPGMSLPAQKALAWAAVHLLLYLERECQWMADYVRGQGGLLVVGTNIHESRRSENQLKGRAARQGDPGETIMLFDLADNLMKEMYSASSKMFRESMRINERNRAGERWWDGVFLDGMLKPVTTATESMIREQRSSVKQYDEVLETFRQHAYSLRRLILNGSNDRSLNMLRMYFQDQADAWVAEHIDARKPVRSWDWGKLRAQVNKLLDPPTDPKSSPSPGPMALPTASSSGRPPVTVSFVDINRALPDPSASPGSSHHTPHAALGPPSPSTPEPSSLDPASASSSSSSNGASNARLPHQQSVHAPQEASTSSTHAPQLQQAPPQLWTKVRQLWPWGDQSQPLPAPQPPAHSSTGSTAGSNAPPGITPAPVLTEVTPIGRKAYSSLMGIPEEAVPDFVLLPDSSAPSQSADPSGKFSIEVCSMEEQETDLLRDALEQGLPLTAPSPFVLDLQYKAKVTEHRRMLRESDKAGHRPRIKGRFGTHAEQLRNWLGEYLLAKYDQTCQLNAQRDPHGSSEWEQYMMLETLDDIWMHFLRETSSLQSAVSLRSFSRMDPIEEFNLEAGATFVQALVNFRQDCVYQAFRGPPGKPALKQFWDRLQSQEKPKENSPAAVAPSSATADAAAVSSSSVPAGKDFGGTRPDTSVSSSAPSADQHNGSSASGDLSSLPGSSGALSAGAVSSHSSDGGGRAKQHELQPAADSQRDQSEPMTELQMQNLER